MSEWITHDGGPCPVDTNALIDVEYADKKRVLGLKAGLQYWSVIYRYRLAQPEPAAPEKNGPKYHGNLTDMVNRQRVGVGLPPIPPEPLARDMTKRERFAMAAMQGMMDSFCRMEIDDMDIRRYAHLAVDAADELLAALEVQRDA